MAFDPRTARLVGFQAKGLQPPQPEQPPAAAGPTLGESAGGYGASLAKALIIGAKAPLDVIQAAVPTRAGQRGQQLLTRGIEAAEGLKPESVQREDAAPIVTRDEAGDLQVDLPSLGRVGRTVVESAGYIPSLLVGARGARNLLARARLTGLPAEATALGAANAATVASGQRADTLNEALALEAEAGQTGPDAVARAEAAADTAFRRTAGLSFLTGAAGLGLASRLGGASASRLAGAAKGFAAEAPFEGIEEFGQNIIADTSLGREADVPGALGAGILGTLAGGLPGAAVGAAEAPAPRARAAPAEPPAEDQAVVAPVVPPVTPVAPAGPVEVEPGVAVDPATGPLSRAAAQGAVEGTLQDIQRRADIAAQQQAEQPGPDAGAQQPRAAAEAAPPAAPPVGPAVQPATAPPAAAVVESIVDRVANGLRDGADPRTLWRTLTPRDKNRLMRQLGTRGQSQTMAEVQEYVDRAARARPDRLARTEQGDLFDMDTGEVAPPPAERTEPASQEEVERRVRDMGAGRVLEGRDMALLAKTLNVPLARVQEAKRKLRAEERSAARRGEAAAPRAAAEAITEIRAAVSDGAAVPDVADIVRTYGLPRAVAEDVRRQAEQPALPAPAREPAQDDRPYDFKTTFPMPRDEEFRRAGRQGLLDQKEDPEESDQEFLARNHEVWQQELEGYAAVQEIAADALRTGVDPATDKAPRTDKARQRLAQRMREEQALAERQIEGMLDEYSNYFGQDAADAFRDAVLGKPAAGQAAQPQQEETTDERQVPEPEARQGAADEARADEGRARPGPQERAEGVDRADTPPPPAAREAAGELRRVADGFRIEAGRAPEPGIARTLSRMDGWIRNGDAAAAADVLQYSNNKVTRRLFQRLTKVKFPRGAKASRKAVLDWFASAGQTPAAPARSPEPAPGPTPSRAPPEPSANRLVTDDMAEAARARIKAALRGRVSAGVDPQLLADGALLALYHIERGARTFAAYAKRMLEDLGDRAKPYLKAWYEGARRMPGFDPKDLTPTADVDAADVDTITTTEETGDAEEVRGDQGPDDRGREAGQGREAERSADLQQSAQAGRAPGEPEDAGGGEAPGTGEAAAAREEAPGEPGGAERTDGDVTDVRPQGPDPGRAGALGEVAAEADRAPSGAKPARQRTRRRGRQDARRDEGAARGGRDDAGGGLAGGARGAPDTGPEGGRVGSEERTDQHEEDVESRDTPATQPHGAPPSNYVIPDDAPLGAGGAKAKFNGNLAAIKLLKDLERERRAPTPLEQQALAAYVGWGGMPQAFPRPNGTLVKGWDREVAALREALTDEEYAAAIRSTQDAHYTSVPVVRGMYQAVQRLGITGGLALEPSVGTGNFIGLAPEGLRANLRWSAVELDSVTGRIAQMLYPQANVVAAKGFQEVNVPLGMFDLAIGNPPFGSQPIHDSNHKDLRGFSIHNFFFAKSIKALKPGGILAMVVSHSMLDKAGGKQRAWMAKHARFLGAIRLPNTAFKANAGTEVTTDIVFLQKLREGEPPGDQAWTQVGTVPDPAGGEPIPVNSWFIAHPEMMLGRMTREGTMRGKNEPTLSPIEGASLEEQLRLAIAHLPENVVDRPADVLVSNELEPPSDVGVSVPVYGHYIAPDGAVHQRLPDVFEEFRSRVVAYRNAGDALRVKAMIGLRDQMRQLMRAELADAPETQLSSQRAALNKAYDTFVKKYGYLNRSYNANLFRTDADAYRLRALEKDYRKRITEKSAARSRSGGGARDESATKADILLRRVFKPRSEPRAQTAQDALKISLNSTGKVDLPRMASMLGWDERRIIDDLGGALFEDPSAGWQTVDQYLSGNVKAKLRAARKAAEDDPRFERNVRALEEVQPPDVPAVDIYAPLGASWIAPQDYAAFAREVIGANLSVDRIEVSGAFTVRGHERGAKRWEVTAVRGELGASRVVMTGAELFRKVINRESIRLYRSVEKGKTELDSEATAAANVKADELSESFNEWIWKDADRRKRLARIYNDTYNTDREGTYDGSFLTLPGKVDDDVITLRPTQKNAVWRAIQTGRVLLDHVVGAGKTYTAIAIGMEMKRMGLMRKPMYAVPNHLVNQWALDFLRLYPAANVLAVTEADFEKDKRKLLFSRIATGDWDGVVIAHSQFSRIAAPQDFEKEYIEEQIAEYEDAVAESKKAGDDNRTTKQLQKARDALRAKLQALLDQSAKDTDTAALNEMGVDGLFVDEAHEFKNLGFVTRKRNVSGLGNPTGSQKAMDLFVKMRYLNKVNGGRNIFFMTGTPVSNALAEMFTMQRYMAYDRLKSLGIHQFDSWANTFAKEETTAEIDTSGRGLKPKTTLKQYLNMPEVMAIYREFADVVTLSDLQRMFKETYGKEWPAPKVKGGRPENVVTPPSPATAAYIDNVIIPRMNAVSGVQDEESGIRLPKPDPRVDNMLKITNDARMAALDIRLRVPGAPDDPSNKVNVARHRIVSIWKAWNDRKGTQLVFCDLSTPKAAVAKEKAALVELERRAAAGDEDAEAELERMSPDERIALESDFSVYDDLRAKLIADGIPADQIAFIHDANTKERRQELFNRVNDGDVRVLIGSTSKMGAGMNVQQRLVALHHLDAPWRPSDLEQREGRIKRQGNGFYEADPEGFEIEIMRYATERTYDSRMWQLIERKATIVEQIRKADKSVRVVEEIGGEAANAAEMKAAATGNPLIIEHVELASAVKRLVLLERNYRGRQHEAQDRIASLEAAPGIEGRHQKRLDHAAAAKAAVEPRKPFKVRVGRQEFEKYADGANALAAAVVDAVKIGTSRKIADYRGYEIHAHKGLWSRWYGAVHHANGDIGFIGDTTNQLIDEKGEVNGDAILRGVDAVLDRIERLPGQSEAQRARETKELSEFKEVLAQPFKQQEELETKRARLAEVEAQLKAGVKGERGDRGARVREVTDDERGDGAPPSASFSKAAPGGPKPRGLNVDALAGAVRRIVAKWSNAPVVRVLATADELPSHIRSHPEYDATVEAVHDTGAIYLIADRFGSFDRAMNVLAHEAVGHFAMEQMLGPEAFAQVTRQVLALRDAGKLSDLFAEVRRRYGAIDDATFAAESIAVMAERGVQNTILGRVIAAVRSFLRRLGFTLEFSGADLRAMIADAGVWLEKGRAKQRMKVRAAPSFSQDDTGTDGIHVEELPFDEAFWASVTERRQSATIDDARRQWEQKGTDSDYFKAWFGESKVVDRAGKPRKLYRGTNHPGTVMRIAGSSSMAGSGLGIFTATQREVAETYGDSVYEFYARAEKPYTMGKDEFESFGSVSESAARRVELQRQGYDAVWLPSMGYWAFFDPNQVKSATANRGTFSRATNDIMFSKMAPEAVLDSIENRHHAGVRTKLFEAVRDKIEDWRPAILQAFTLRQLADLAKQYLPQVKTYVDVQSRMQTRRNSLQEQSGTRAAEWESWQRAKANRGADGNAEKLADLMHDTTIIGVDPSGPFVTSSVSVGGEAIPMTTDAVKAAVARLEAKAAGAPERISRLLRHDIDRLDQGLKAEAEREAAYPRLVERFNALPAEAKALFRNVRDDYRKRSDDLLSAVLARIETLEVSPGSRAALAAKVRGDFEAARVQGPYFPLARFGEFWISAERDGTRSFWMAETQGEWKAKLRELRADGYKIAAQGVKLDTARALHGASGGFMGELNEILDEANVRDDVRDDIYQLYLRTLPDLSVRKQFIHRKKVKGYSADALRAYAGNMFHSAHQLARLEYSHQLERAMADMRKAADTVAEGDDPDRAARAGRMVNEMQHRHEWVMNPRGAAWAQAASSAGFTFYLGMTPAAALVNLTQTAITTLPALASRFGWAAAMRELGRSVTGSARHFGNIRKTLTDPSEVRAWTELEAMGALDLTQSHNLAGIAETDTYSYNPTWHRTMKVVSALFHKAEVVNREGSGLAAYRLARSKGMDHTAAVQYAADIIYRTHFDYSNANRARFMQGNVAKVLFAFKQYAQNMTYFLWRSAYEAFKGATPQERRMARRQLAGTLGMTMVFSGVLGLPLMTMGFQIANAMAAVFGDDDEPFDAETEFRLFLVSMLGQDLGKVAQVGLVQSTTGIGIAERTKLDQLWFRPPDRELEGRALADYWLEQIAGPVVGIGVNAFRAGDLILDGMESGRDDWLWRGVETAMPKAVKDAMKTARFAHEGVRNLRGDPMVKDLGVGEFLLQGSGFAPARVAEVYEVNRAVKDYERQILDRRQALIDAYALGMSQQDKDVIRQAFQSIMRFNSRHPTIAIRSNTLRRSLQARLSYSERAINGIMVNPKIEREVREAGRFF